MELSKKYVLKVYDTKSFSKAAKELHISQPSLSATVKKLESELGFVIFDRSQTPIALTPQGNIYIEYLNQTIINELEMQRRITALDTTPQETLTVGGFGLIAELLLPKACGEFYRRFPDTKIKIDLGQCGPENHLLNRLAEGQLDVIITYNYDKKIFTGIPFTEERCFLAVRRDFPNAFAFAPYAVSREDIISGKAFSDHHISDYNIPKNLPLLSQNAGLIHRANLNDFAQKFKTSKNFAVNYTNSALYYDMMLAGMGAAITSELTIAARKEKSDEVYFLPITIPTATRSACLVYKKDIPLTKSAENFISIVLEMCKNRKKFLENL